MSQISDSLLVPFSTEKMYRLVNDVSSYPQFLSGCISSQVLNANDFFMTASIEISIAGFIRQRFITRNTLTHNHSIHIQLLEGPFRTLSGIWNFTAKKKETCQVQLHLNVEFTNIFMEIAFKTTLDKIHSSLLKAFNKRAREVYTA
ncbi:Ribosome association toxin RatA [Candidatus Erwinia haradaeae]|uniref:Ribosome association toxin RatA n=1 Tax=Candidatus Erwinia haradaeae TaxID=1922217 RepID=A0A451DDD8_9GAMM|nr:SRPBCC family protein [Candidatus Erwinia haradaeae]VFP84494.1 Ribosome association toxin RatA [Candidatus Erwinia haradaeae]